MLAKLYKLLCAAVHVFGQLCYNLLLVRLANIYSCCSNLELDSRDEKQLLELALEEKESLDKKMNMLCRKVSLR